MPALDDESGDNSSTVADIYIPTTTEGTQLLWDGNYARILGLLNETNKHCVRKAILQPFIKHGVALVSNGRTAIPSLATIPFIQGTVLDGALATPITYSLVNLRPATIGERVTTAAAGRVARGEAPFDFAAVAASPDFPINLMACEKEDGTLLRVLTHVFGHADESDSLLDDAAGSGMALARELTRLASTATPADIAVVTANYDTIRSQLVQGELTVSSLKGFVKEYKKAKIDIYPVVPPPGAEVQMINLIAFKDSSIRDMHELKSTATPPTTLDASVKLLNGILTSRLRAEELDQASSGAPKMGLVAAKARAAAAPPPPPAAAPSASDLYNLKLLALLTKLEGKLGVADPNKEVDPKPLGRGRGRGRGRGARSGGGGGGKPNTDADADAKVKPPRDGGGRILKWIDGMDLCVCGKPHLYRDCQDPATKAKFQNGAAKVSELDQLSTDQLQAAIAGFLNGKVTENFGGVCEIEETETSSAGSSAADNDDGYII